MTRRGPHFAEIFGRELDRLASEVEAYSEESDLWVRQGTQGNAPGTLTLHLVGCLHHYIGAALGGTGYVRDRPAEFSDRDVPRERLLEVIQGCRDTIVPTLAGLDGAALDDVYPGEAPVRMQGISTNGYLTHLVWHTGWHLGQIYYHRLACEAVTG